MDRLTVLDELPCDLVSWSQSLLCPGGLPDATGWFMVESRLDTASPSTKLAVLIFELPPPTLLFQCRRSSSSSHSSSASMSSAYSSLGSCLRLGTSFRLLPPPIPAASLDTVVGSPPPLLLILFLRSTKSEYPAQGCPLLVHVEHSGFSPAHRVFLLRHVKHLQRDLF